MRKLPQVLNWRVLRLWLSLLVLGSAFWTIGRLMTLRVLGRTYDTSRYVITDVQPEKQDLITAISVEICTESSTSEAKVISNNPSDYKLQLDLTVPDEIENAISRKLNIPLQEVRGLVHYKISNACSR